jgi:hypothetical protein
MIGQQDQQRRGRRLLECLQQRIAGGGVEHVGWVDQRDPPSAQLTGQGQTFADAADLVDHDLAAQFAFAVERQPDPVQVRMGSRGA